MLNKTVSRSVGWFFRIGTIANSYESKHVAQAAKKSISGASGRRSISSAAGRRSISSGSSTWPPEHLKKSYAKFQQENGIPVYLKGGPADRILFGLTAVLIAIGLADGIFTLLTMAFPQKKH